MQAGYYCSVCDCILRDSQSYLDHINGKWHNRALGTSMRVERSTADEVIPQPCSPCCAFMLLIQGLHSSCWDAVSCLLPFTTCAGCCNRANAVGNIYKPAAPESACE